MGKIFEDVFMEIQTDMVSVCSEYAEGKADKIYICCLCEKHAYTCNFFFKINNILVRKHKINDMPDMRDIDVSVQRQDRANAAILDNIKKLRTLCCESGRDMPAEIKIIYDKTANKMQTIYRYDSVYSQSSDTSDYDIFNAWFDSLKSMANMSEKC